ncbi:MAG TPA: type II toxin-antitoxin system Phd/YefM family antitoxin [Bryobacteraceae bacterium]|nr:type II toxin-antitoxin system Phd/YefM family antitoxin [Bryobacteraceae bacterium]
MKLRTVSVTAFKTNCSTYLDEVERYCGSVTITRRGRPVAVLRRVAWKSPRNSWAGKMRIVGDIVNCDTSDLWELD